MESAFEPKETPFHFNPFDFELPDISKAISFGAAAFSHLVRDAIVVNSNLYTDYRFYECIDMPAGDFRPAEGKIYYQTQTSEKSPGYTVRLKYQNRDLQFTMPDAQRDLNQRIPEVLQIAKLIHKSDSQKESCYMSFDMLMRGCDFYSTQTDGSGDIFALGLVAVLCSPFYLIYRLISDSGIAVADQTVKAMNDLYMTADVSIDFHTSGSGLTSVPGLILGGAIRTVGYVGGVLGLSSSGYHHAALGFKNCINFIFDAGFVTKEHVLNLKLPRKSTVATVLREFNLIRITNGLGMVITGALGVLGLTQHSVNFMESVLSSLYTAAFLKSEVSGEEPSDTELSHKPVGLAWAAQFGLAGLVGIALGTGLISLMKIISLSGRLLGFSGYAFMTVMRAGRVTLNFIAGTEEYTNDKLNDAIFDHETQDYQTLESRADRSLIGINRVINGFIYGVGLTCAVLGLTAHAMRAMQRNLNITSNLLFDYPVFDLSDAEKKAYSRAVYRKSEDGTVEVTTGMDTKESLARFGLASLIGFALGSTLLVAAKTASVTGRLAGISNYSLLTIQRCMNACGNFIFGTENTPQTDLLISESDSHDDLEDPSRNNTATENAILLHQNKMDQSLEDYADRSWFGLNRIINGFAYSVTFVCGILGLTAHSMRFMQGNLSLVYKSLYTVPASLDTFTVHQPSSFKEKLAQFGLLGLIGTVMGSIGLILSKLVVLTARSLGISEYSANTIRHALDLCLSYLFADQPAKQAAADIKRHEDNPDPTLEDRADRSPFGINRLINGFAYSVTFACNILGLTAHNFINIRRTLNNFYNMTFGGELFQIPNNYSIEKYSKEWVSAHINLLGIASITLGAISILLAKSLSIATALLGLSGYGLLTVRLAFKDCARFIAGSGFDATVEQNAIDAHLSKNPQSLQDYADRSWFGFNRILNGFAYCVTFTCGILGLNAHSLRFMQNNLNTVYESLYSTVPSINVLDDTQATTQQRLAQYGLLGLLGTALGTAGLALTKFLMVSGRLFGFSAYGAHTISRAFKNCAHFIFGGNYKEIFSTKKEDAAIYLHKSIPNPTVEEWADGSYFGLNRFINGFLYAVSFTCGVLGLTAHSIHSLQNGLNVIYAQFFEAEKPLFDFTNEEKRNYQTFDTLPETELNVEVPPKEWYARGGMLALAGIAVGAIVIPFARVVSLIGRSLGISEYSANSISLAFQNCANSVFNAGFNIDETEKRLQDHEALQSLQKMADRSRLGINNLINVALYGFTAILGIIGLTASNYHRAARFVKNINNVFADGDQQANTKEHDDYILADKSAFISVTSELNLLLIAGKALKYVVWFAAATVTFIIRRAWKLTLGNLIPLNACGKDGTLGVLINWFGNSSISSLDDRLLTPVEIVNQRFHDLLWSLDPYGNLPDNMTFKNAIEDARTAGSCKNAQWRIRYDLRKSASIFGLNTIHEKMILHFASTFKEYIAQERKEARQLPATVSLLTVSFFKKTNFNRIVSNVQSKYKTQDERDKVLKVAKAIKNDFKTNYELRVSQ